ncbi:hypothetical protein GWI33_022542 [Rhynchophorus ferrugineus]|uniref:Methionyl-tRNA formyltransferase, mitochondrial n=1 Tax=Rhynchophorus ferrugineus TaxID=354439 RepID=A0A834HPQ3_RHYFE|nr:hypothetical protein GWI33_022545 [Rhynchophorus ferrugineus]KAF7264715.1 hypothetical protein GWI33_022542 [Rhynchophorus ferrugineus]
MFFGSDNFALYSLKSLLNEHKHTNTIKVLDVVTNSNKNPIWKYSEEHKLNIINWPPEIYQNYYDLGVVVSFGYLIPEQIINKFKIGMLNVHASLLPRWRGAAPIIYALANGDRETGVTVMQIKPKKFDIGEVLMQRKVSISDNMTMPELHKILGHLGAECLVETIRNLEGYLLNCKPQSSEGITYAPKITPEFARIKWNRMTSKDIYNLARALEGIHHLTTNWGDISLKLIDISIDNNIYPSKEPGSLEYVRSQNILRIECAKRTFIKISRIGIPGKKVMSANDFNNGFLKKQAVDQIYTFK